MIRDKCFKCIYREIGCHARCSDYAAYRKLIDKARKSRDREKIYFDYMRDKGRR